MKNILITGSKGFIGSNLADMFHGDNVIHCDYNVNKTMTPRQIALNALENLDISVVYHLGAISATTETDIAKLSENNIHFSTELLQICIEKDIPFVFASSASVYGLGKEGFSEETKLTPLNYYAISKASFDMLAKKKIEDYPKAKIVGLRYFNVYGHNEDHKCDMASPVHKFFEQSKTGKIKVFEGSENFKRDFIHVEDVSRITKLATGFKSGIYNVGTGESRSFLEVANIISKLTCVEVEEIPFPSHLVGKYQDFTCSDNTQIDSVYQSNRTCLERGIEKVYERRS